MAAPQLLHRGDMIVMVDWDNTETFTNFCGATAISLNIENAMSETAVGDCDDWKLPVQTVVEYGAQTSTMTINAQLARSNLSKLLSWAKDQLELPVRVHIVDAASGTVEYIDGVGLLTSQGIEGIGNTEGTALTQTINVRFKHGIEFTNAA
ncbi:phage tail tube protein [Thioclava sp. GXIMD2076]|uniref:phage tail tube protein n=1 Tax=Thioclava sp. GXIMD2076 TaxID=3131931 RepID=UPI0030CC3FB3